MSDVANYLVPNKNLDFLMNDDISLYDNEKTNRYEVSIDGKLSRIEYIKTKNEIYLTHTEVAKGQEGKGIGKEMIAEALADIKNKNLKLVPLCPFVASYIRSHPEWKTILKKGINI